MMDWVWLAFYLLVILTLGMVGAKLFTWKEECLFSETLSLVVILGTGSLGYLLFLLGLVGVRPTRWSFVVLFVVTMIPCIFFFRNWKIPINELRSGFLHITRLPFVVSTALFILLLIFQSIVLVHALGSHLYEWDAFAIWGLKAKVIALKGIIPCPDYFGDLSLGYSHLDYPLMIPFLMAGVYGVLGHIDDQMAKLSLPVIYFGLMCLVFAFSKRRLPTPAAFTITAIVMGTPVMLRWAGSGNADVPLTAFYTASVVYLLDWEEHSKWRSCVLCGILSGFAAFTKNEGLALGAINCLVIFLFPIRSQYWRRRLSGAVLCVATFIILILPWLIWSNDIPRTEENYPAHLRFSEIIKNVSRIPIILSEFVSQVVSIWQYGLIWLILIVSAIIRWRAFCDRTTFTACSLFLLHLVTYFLIFLVTPWDIRELLSVALDRLVLHILPVGGLLIALFFSSWIKGTAPQTSV